MVTKKHCIVIAGATGVGKTDLALLLARHMKIEIVNADLGQFYAPFTIGTAKPAWQTDPIPHHLFDIYTAPHVSTAVQYRQRLRACLDEIWQRGNIPVIVGGSTFYVESIFFEPIELGHKETNAVKPLEISWQRLYCIDPERALKIHPHDYYRIERALILWNTTGVLPSLQQPIFSPLCDFSFVYLTRDRNDLYERINKRVHIMFEQGWLEEVKALIGTQWIDFINTKKFIGYPEILEFIENKAYSYDELIAIIAQKTRNYAKRQETYWRRLKNKLDNCLVATPEYTKGHMSTVHEINTSHATLQDTCMQLAKILLNE